MCCCNKDNEVTCLYLLYCNYCQKKAFEVTGFYKLFFSLEMCGGNLSVHMPTKGSFPTASVQKIFFILTSHHLKDFISFVCGNYSKKKRYM